MTQPNSNTSDAAESKAPEAVTQKPCESGTANQAPVKKKLSLDIEEIGEVLERKISP